MLPLCFRLHRTAGVSETDVFDSSGYGSQPQCDFMKLNGFFRVHVGATGVACFVGRSRKGLELIVVPSTLRPQSIFSRDIISKTSMRFRTTQA